MLSPKIKMVINIYLVITDWKKLKDKTVTSWLEHTDLPKDLNSALTALPVKCALDSICTLSKTL